MVRRFGLLLLVSSLATTVLAQQQTQTSPLMGGTTYGQTAPAASAPSLNLPATGIQSPGTSTPGAANSATPVPSAAPATGQGEGNLATQRPSDQTQRNSAPLAVAPAPLTEFQQIVAESTGRTLPIFGAGLFNSVPSTFAPVDNIPVTPDYVIGPGDELRIQIWGQVNQQGAYYVDRTGSIALPEVGTVHVAGVQFSQLRDFLMSQLGRIYRNFDLNVNLGQLRSIQVFVVGQARKPGSYTIGSLSTLLNALFASGGPLPQGSLRDIQVKRGGETITHFDLYDLLLHGDKTKDVRLESGDVIFIPEVGPQVAVLGSVTTPAIYELRGEKSFSQMIALAGGLTNVAADSRLRVERIYNHTERNMIDVDLASGDSTPVQNGDIVNVSSIIDRFKDAVTLRGNVANPGRYVWHQGMRISDLIPNREALITRNYYLRQNQLGQSNRDYTGAEGSLGIQSGAVGGAAVRREAAASGVAGNSSVGSVLTVGNSNFGASTDVILSAPDIDWNYAVIERQNASDLTTSLLAFNLGKAVLDKDPSQDLELLSGDVVTIFSQADIRAPSAQQTKFVKLEGEFVGAGVYSALPGETFRHLVERAGGLTPNAYLYGSEYTRESTRVTQQARIDEYVQRLSMQIQRSNMAMAASPVSSAQDLASGAAAQSNERDILASLRQIRATGRIVLRFTPDSSGTNNLPDISMEDGDRFIVPAVPATVNVVGSVYDQNSFLYAKGQKAGAYLQLAGGPNRDADRKHEFLIRADGEVVSHDLGRGLWNNKFDNLHVYPGDTIMVPEKNLKPSSMRSVIEWSQIISSMGMGFALMGVLL